VIVLFFQMMGCASFSDPIELSVNTSKDLDAEYFSISVRFMEGMFTGQKEIKDSA